MGLWVGLVGLERIGWLPASLSLSHNPLACLLPHFSGRRKSDCYYGQSAIYCRQSDKPWLLSTAFVHCGVASVAA